MITAVSTISGHITFTIKSLYECETNNSHGRVVNETILSLCAKISGQLKPG